MTSKDNKNDIEKLLDVEIISPDLISLLQKQYYSTPEERGQLEEIVQKIEQSIKRIKDATKLNNSYLILGVCFIILDRIEEAINMLNEVKGRKETNFFLGKCYLERGEYKKAEAFFELSLNDNIKGGINEVDIKIEIAETKRKRGDAAGAKKIMEGLYDLNKGNPELHYQLGHCLDDLGFREKATEEYKLALEIDPAYPKALFRLAFNYDICGEDQLAIEYYERCNQLPVKYTNSFFNLGVLYEDAGEYEKALACYDTVLKSDPNSYRAQLFLQDVKASINMYYDENLLKKQAKDMDALNIPISDFELSVRSRNCLEKIGINTLGDLTKVTEHDLLSYKNFGETSLLEIKNIMAQKGLRLGQAIESKQDISSKPTLNDSLKE